MSNLSEIRENMFKQDNRATAHPLFVVYDWEKVPANPLWVDEFEYADTYDGYNAIGDTKEDLINYAKDDGIKLPDRVELDRMDGDDLLEFLLKEREQLIKNHYIEKRVFVNAFFTESAAEEFIKQNKHHYSDKVHVFVVCLWRNPEMQYIRGLLLDKKLVETCGHLDAETYHKCGSCSILICDGCDRLGKGYCKDCNNGEKG